MAIITFPAMRIVNSVWGIQYNVQTFTSPFTQQQQVRALRGDYWYLQITTSQYRRYFEAEGIAIESFLNQLRGGTNTFLYNDPDYRGARGVATGSPVVNGAGQTGNSLATSGWTANITNILRSGDYFTVNGELKRLISDANSNGSGQATLNFEPALRASPSNSAPLNVATPTAEFVLAATGDNLFSSDASRLVTYSFTARERFPI